MHDLLVQTVKNYYYFSFSVKSLKHRFSLLTRKKRVKFLIKPVGELISH